MLKYEDKQNFSFLSIPKWVRSNASKSFFLSRWKQWPASLPIATMGGARKPPGPKSLLSELSSGNGNWLLARTLTKPFKTFSPLHFGRRQRKLKWKTTKKIGMEDVTKKWFHIYHYFSACFSHYKMMTFLIKNYRKNCSTAKIFTVWQQIVKFWLLFSILNVENILNVTFVKKIQNQLLSISPIVDLDTFTFVF